MDSWGSFDSCSARTATRLKARVFGVVAKNCFLEEDAKDMRWVGTAPFIEVMAKVMASL